MPTTRKPLTGIKRGEPVPLTTLLSEMAKENLWVLDAPVTVGLALGEPNGLSVSCGNMRSFDELEGYRKFVDKPWGEDKAVAILEDKEN